MDLRIRKEDVKETAVKHEVYIDSYDTDVSNDFSVNSRVCKQGRSTSYGDSENVVEIKIERTDDEDVEYTNNGVAYRSSHVEQKYDIESGVESLLEIKLEEGETNTGNNGRDYRKVVNEHSRAPSERVIIEKPFECPDCGKCFQRKDYLRQHSVCHLGIKPYKCTYCGKNFTRNCELRVHTRIHFVDRPYRCVECGKCFTQSGNLKEHMKIHTGEKPFKCDQCGKSFSQLTSYREHLRIHTGEKPFHCKLCGRNFTHSGNLKKHLKTHSGDRPFKCETCGKSFTQTSNLKTHLKTHVAKARPHPKPCSPDTFQQICNTNSAAHPFKCVDCGKDFSQSTTLRGNLRIHMGERSFSCSECVKIFAQLCNLKAHNYEDEQR